MLAIISLKSQSTEKAIDGDANYSSLRSGNTRKTNRNHDLRITDVETIMLRVPTLKQDCEWSEDAVLVKIHTNKGIYGIGESDSSPLVIKSIIETPSSHSSCVGLREILIGENPLEIEKLWNKMFEASNYMGRSGAGIHAISALDIALWDLSGKYYGTPVHTLIGGKYRDRIKAYGTFEPSANLDVTRFTARDLRKMGYTSLKIGGGALGDDDELDLAIVKTVRDEVGDECDLQLDLVGKWKTASHAKFMIHQLSKYRLKWVEEPVLAHDLAGYARLSEQNMVAISGGEGLTTRWEFQPFISLSKVDIVQPDVTRCGGISEIIKINELAKGEGRTVVPHGFSTGILIAATAHFLASIDAGQLIEYSASNSPLGKHLVKNSPKFKDGYVNVPDAPGLGIELDESVVDKYRIHPNQIFDRQYKSANLCM
ncbi:MAG: mandelate racemase/muconate lactonizing enzyme family protein [Oligoflexales bacterium]|nr:mandelate racemase/muconate lactonizing enzyme family protein [Oligoflexales bacterium]